MPKIEVRLFRTIDGKVPLLDWLDGLKKVRLKCIERIQRLAECGYELPLKNRNEAAYLRDGIFELRVRRQQVNYRILYFFYRNEAVILSHGLMKEKVVPPSEIDLALRRKAQYEANPNRHTYNGEL